MEKKIHDKMIMDLDINPKEELIMTADKDGKPKVLETDTFDIMSELFPLKEI